MRRRWAVFAAACTTVLAAAACTTSGGLIGDGGPSDPRGLLGAGAEAAQQAGSARFIGSSTAFASGGTPIAYDGTLSWSPGTTAEIHTRGAAGPGGATNALITEDAIYGETPPALGALGVPGLAGKKWIKQPLDGLEQQFGPVGEVFRAALDQTNPVRSAALLLQSGDLRVVGRENRNNVATTHYTGTIQFDKLVADLRLGLSDKAIADLRDQARAQGSSAEQLDLWIDQRGLPVRAEGRTNDAKLGQVLTTADYTDYGGPKPVVAPPPDQVLDISTLRGVIPGPR